MASLIERHCRAGLDRSLCQQPWGSPGTIAYQTYELLNRLIAVALLCMAAGWLGLAQRGWGGKAAWLAFAFSIVVAAATAAEFWLFTDQPYGSGSDLHNAAFSAFSIGDLIFDLAVTAMGVSIWRGDMAPRWLGARI